MGSRLISFGGAYFLTMLFGAAFSANGAEPAIALQSEQAVSFTLPAESFTRDFFIDVSAEDKQLKIELTSSPNTNDIDIFVRYGSPFPETAEVGGPPKIEYIQEMSHYRSISSESNEAIVVNPFAGQPIRAGRWYIAAYNYGTTAGSTVTLKASRSAANLPNAVFEPDFSGGEGCDASGWNDATARTPVSGNPGTTLGQQRRNAVTEALRLLSQSYNLAFPITIQACWADLGTGNSVTLAQAGPRAISINTDVRDSGTINGQPVEASNSSRFLPRNHTFYSATALARLNGTRLCGVLGGPCTGASIRATFNTKIDTPEALGSASYYYGFNNLPNGSNDIDFVSVAMHEITHGLGFISLVNVREGEPIGSKESGFDDIYSANLSHVTSDAAGNSITRNYMDVTTEERAQALVSGSGLRWNEPRAVESFLNSFAGFPSPDNMIWMHTPSTIAPGSTQSHIGIRHAPSLMLAQSVNNLKTPGLSGPMLEAVGWSKIATPPPTIPNVINGQYFDPKHPGHGIDFQKVAGTNNIYTLIFYTYDANGLPEWYLTVGPVIDGVFMPETNIFGDSISKYRYSNTVPHQIAVQSTGNNGLGDWVRIDFNQPQFNDVCRGASGEVLGIMTFSIGADRNVQWCLQPLLPTALRPSSQNFTGTWYSGEDSGWGFAMGSYSPTNLFSLLFYPDSQNNGRWAYATNDTSNTNSASLFQRKGYCRTCTPPASALAGQFEDTAIGTASFDLRRRTYTDVNAGNKTTISVKFLGDSSNGFTRTNAPLLVLAGDAD